VYCDDGDRDPIWSRHDIPRDLNLREFSRKIYNLRNAYLITKTILIINLIFILRFMYIFVQAVIGIGINYFFFLVHRWNGFLSNI